MSISNCGGGGGGSGLALVLTLYRSLLRLHRTRLPPQLRDMGDAYARAEFSAHLKGSTTPQQWGEFGRAWRGYLLSLGGPDVAAGAGTGHGVGGEEDAQAVAEAAAFAAGGFHACVCVCV